VRQVFISIFVYYMLIQCTNIFILSYSVVRMSMFIFLFIFVSSFWNIHLTRNSCRYSVPSTSTSGNPSRAPDSTQIGLAALQQKALKQQEQLEQTPLGFRFPLQMSPLFTRAELGHRMMKPRRDFIFWFIWFFAYFLSLLYVLACFTRVFRGWILNLV